MAESSRKIIIYGAGKRGSYYDFLQNYRKLDNVIGFCDQNYMNIKKVDNKRVMSYEEACGYHKPFLIALADDKISNAIKNKIEESGERWLDFEGISEYLEIDKVGFNRDWCAYCHFEDDYFCDAESAAGLKVFWGENSPFLAKFQQLNLKNVIELACGRGRHVPKYMEIAGEITLVDILSENINICRERFKDESNIKYYCNNGYNLEELESDTYTAIFSYDAMVHFEMMDIYEYLKDFYRVLVPGGKALIHHSNNTSDYKASFSNAPHGRSFMSKEIFAYLAYRAGFTVLEQEVIGWGIKGVNYRQDLDCISLIQKKD